MTKLMNPGKPTKDDMVLNNHMTSECRIIGKGIVIANDTVMGNMDICHNPVLVTHTGNPATTRRSPVDRTKLAYHIMMTHHQF